MIAYQVLIVYHQEKAISIACGFWVAIFIDYLLRAGDSKMSEIAKTIGQRIRNYRYQAGLSQEKVAELSGCHPTYIGQVERGEKNATLESIEKIAIALNVPLAQLFEKYDTSFDNGIPAQCYDFLLSKSKSEQEELFKILLEIEKYKKTE